MSAWIVSRAHIHVLVNGLVGLGIVPLEQATETGRLLWGTNHDSVNFRYGESTPTPKYTFVRARKPLHHLHLLAAEECYEYQSCEHAEWKDSTASLLCWKLREAIEERWPGAYEEYRTAHRSYGDDTEPGVRWGYHRLSDASRPVH